MAHFDLHSLEKLLYDFYNLTGVKTCLYDAEGNELHLEDILGTEANIVTKGLEEENDKKELYREIEKLDARDKEIMILRYGLFNHEEMTQKDVAEKLGISH